MIDDVADPLAVVTVRVSVCVPFATPVVFHVYQSVLPVLTDCVVRTRPSTESVQVFAAPHEADVDMPTLWLPPTVALFAGYVIDVVKPAGGGGGGGVGVVPFETLTARVADAVAPVESVSVSESV